MVPFEGAEKKCEVIVRSHIDLRSLPPQFWHTLVAACSAEVLSVVHNDDCDAYLLSESSLFVWTHRMLLITCGRTQLVQSIHHLLDELGQPAIEYLLFQRKHEYFAHLQPTSFDDDVATLQARLPGSRLLLGSRDGHYTQLFHMHSDHQAPASDRTSELLMHHLSDAATTALTQPGLSARAIRDFLRLDTLFPGATIDDFVFDPFGYSLNAIRGREYLTIHITPERDGSYVSLETNLDLAPILACPLEVLSPQSFDLVLYNAPDIEGLLHQIPSVYTSVARQSERLPSGYQLEFAHLARMETP